MNVFDLVTLEELADLPEDPQAAFLEIVRLAQNRLKEKERTIADDQYGWQELNDGRHSFMNVVVAAGKRFGIEPFLSMQVPQVSSFDDSSYRQFMADLEHYIVQMLIDNSIRSKRDSVSIDPKAKDKIRGYINGLKKCIDNSTLTESKRAALLEKLAKFEAELDKKRVSFLSAARITIEILAIPGALWGSYEMVSRLSSNVLQVIGEAKAIDDETRELPSFERPAALLPPRDPEPQPTSTDLSS